MSKTTDFLAVDLGGSSGRVVSVRWDGKQFSIGDAHRFPNISVNVHGTAHWDVLRLWTDIQDGLRAYVSKSGNNAASIGVDTWGVDFGLLDSAGKLLGNPICYRDTRTNGMPDKLCEAVAKQEIFDIVGTHFIQFNTLITPWYVADKKIGGITMVTGWSEVALARANAITGAMPPGGADPFDGSLLDLLKNVS